MSQVVREIAEGQFPADSSAVINAGSALPSGIAKHRQPVWPPSPAPGWQLGGAEPPRPRHRPPDQTIVYRGLLNLYRRPLRRNGTAALAMRGCNRSPCISFVALCCARIGTAATVP